MAVAARSGKATPTGMIHSRQEANPTRPASRQSRRGGLFYLYLAGSIHPFLSPEGSVSQVAT